MAKNEEKAKILQTWMTTNQVRSWSMVILILKFPHFNLKQTYATFAAAFDYGTIQTPIEIITEQQSKDSFRVRLLNIMEFY